jgi:co-chaperonin GroES (HSP10)
MFKPVNRHILLAAPEDEQEDKPTIILPDEYKPTKQKYTTAQVMGFADDIRFDLKQGSKILIDQTMIEQIVANNTTYNVILDNYVVGIID